MRVIARLIDIVETDALLAQEILEAFIRAAVRVANVVATLMMTKLVMAATTTAVVVMTMALIALYASALV